MANATTPAPTSYVVINGRAYFTDANENLVSAGFGDVTPPKFDEGESLIDLGLLSDPAMAKPAGQAIDALRNLFRGKPAQVSDTSTTSTTPSGTSDDDPDGLFPDD